MTGSFVQVQVLGRSTGLLAVLEGVSRGWGSAVGDMARVCARILVAHSSAYAYSSANVGTASATNTKRSAFGIFGYVYTDTNSNLLIYREK